MTDRAALMLLFCALAVLWAFALLLTPAESPLPSSSPVANVLGGAE